MERQRHAALTAQEEDHFRELLMSEARDLLKLDRDLEDEFSGFTIQGKGELSHVRFHGADMGTDEFYQEFVMRLAEKETAELQQIQDALESLRNGTYGVCRNCGTDIDKARLEALPEALTCLACQEEIEAANSRQRPRDTVREENNRENYFVRSSRGDTPAPSDPPPAPY